jgi:hypothetical protein
MRRSGPGGIEHSSSGLYFVFDQAIILLILLPVNIGFLTFAAIKFFQNRSRWRLGGVARYSGLLGWHCCRK